MEFSHVNFWFIHCCHRIVDDWFDTNGWKYVFDVHGSFPPVAIFIAYSHQTSQICPEIISETKELS